MPTVFDKAIFALSPYLWNRGKTNIQIPIEQMFPPDPKWGARRQDPKHVEVCFLFLKL